MHLLRWLYETLGETITIAFYLYSPIGEGFIY
nr:MAG TPA: hypothetical protein [Caudoviricetes sp.]